MNILKKNIEQESKNSNRKSRFIYIGSFLLLVFGISIISLKQFNIYFTEKQEEDKIRNFIELQKNEISKNSEPNTNSVSSSNENFVAVLEIPKINLKKGLYDITSQKNNVNKNIEILSGSDYPNIKNGNFILAGHSGTGQYAYFNNLVKLETDDYAYVYYNGIKYSYKLKRFYEIEKTGSANLIKNKNTSSLTLITCKINTNKQLVFVFDLEKESVM